MPEDKAGVFDIVQRSSWAAPRVSVVMGVRDDEAGRLKASLASLQAQTMSEWELVCVDDASGAATAMLLDKFAASDKRVTLLRHVANTGLTRALIRGIAASRAPVLARQDADDTSLPDRLARQLDFFPRYDLVCSRTWLNDERISPKWLTVLAWPLVFARKNPFIHGTWMLTRAIYDAVGGYDPDMRYAQDYDMMARLIRRGVRVKYLMEPLYRSYKTASAISRRHRAAQQECFDRVRQRMPEK